MQIRSLIASTAPNAQHDPQVLWSLTYLIESHFGQFSAEEKVSGISFKGSISFKGNLRCSGVYKAPIIPLMVSRSMFSNLLLTPAFQEVCKPLMFSMIDLKSMKDFYFLAKAVNATKAMIKSVKNFIINRFIITISTYFTNLIFKLNRYKTLV